MDELMDISQMAEYMRISKSQTYKYAENGKLPGFKIGRLWRFRKRDIENFITSIMKGGEVNVKGLH
jgi:excisionase family DNA binding protein